MRKSQNIQWNTKFSNSFIRLFLFIFVLVCQTSLYKYGRASFTPKEQELSTVSFNFNLTAKSGHSSEHNFGGHPNPIATSPDDSDQDESSNFQDHAIVLDFDLGHLAQISPEPSARWQHDSIFEPISRRLIAYHSSNSPPFISLSA